MQATITPLKKPKQASRNLTQENEASPQQAAGYQTEGHCRGDTTVSPPSSLCKVTSEQAPRNLLIEQSLSPSLGGLAIAWVFFDVRNHPCIENALPIACGIKAAIEVEIDASQVFVVRSSAAIRKEHKGLRQGRTRPAGGSSPRDALK